MRVYHTLFPTDGKAVVTLVTEEAELRELSRVLAVAQGYMHSTHPDFDKVGNIRVKIQSLLNIMKPTP
jgi:hypothetical protein